MGKVVGRGLSAHACAAAWSPAGAAGTGSLAIALSDGSGAATSLAVGDVAASTFIQGSVVLPAEAGAGTVGAMGWSGFSRGGTSRASRKDLFSL